MKDKDIFKNIINKYNIPNGEEGDISTTIFMGQKSMNCMVKSRTPFIELLKYQARYISPYLWATQVICIIMIIQSSSNLTNPDLEIRQLLFSITPLLAFLVVPELIKSAIYGMTELETSCKNSISKVLLTRLFIIGCINLLSITIIVYFINVRYSMPFTEIIVYGLVPFNVVNGINLLIVQFTKVRYSALTMIISLGCVVLMSLVTQLSFFVLISKTMWIVLLLVTTGFLFAELYYFIYSVTNKEVYIQWN
ncbi:hypothetical protein KPL28_05030 [Clostridium algidicarnis]|uniref:hypothetical protein n=1 Tax=Clostridium algidicarnis TaxID=37659 RepID=UPI001C0C013D|nr:hypothetical protein [Clostridium algidicarnis]MBU3209005.1 hypothetical protein [Clostridium algidicarnis]